MRTLAILGPSYNAGTNAMPKRQAAELIELDGGELRRELN
jgi:hypothetical protein